MPSRRPLLSLLLLLPLLSSSGCLLADPAEVAGDSPGTAAMTRTADCGTHVTLARYASGAGAVDIKVSDSAGVVIYDVNAEVTGQLDDSLPLVGSQGTWTLAVDPAGFAGQFKITLSCL